jgi:hypothetical protein
MRCISAADGTDSGAVVCAAPAKESPAKTVNSSRFAADFFMTAP